MALTAVVLAALSLAFVGSAWAFARRQLGALVPVREKPLAGPLLVVIPARNEAARIGPALDALLAEPSAALALVVVDDRSDDDTAAVVDARARNDGRVRLLRLADDPPAGTFGKPRALQAAVDDALARSALPERVLFLDADVVTGPGFLGGLVDAAQATKADALSGVPRLVTASAVEDMLVPALASVVTGRFVPTRVHDAGDATAFLNGQIVLVTSAALADCGGWAAVSGTVLEDVALARALKARGRTLRLADLRALASTRMYDSFAAIDAGFGKNATALLGRTAGVVGAFAFVMSLLPWTAVALSARALVVDDGASFPWAAGALALVAATMLAQAATRRLAGAPLWPVCVLPLAYLGVAFVLVRASLRTAVTWKGRTYPR